MTTDDVYKYLTERFPTKTDWIYRDFHCFNGVPEELKWIVYTDKIEFEIQNGLLPQLLWNTIFHWRRLLVVGKSGYLSFGFHLQAEALCDFEKLFLRFEKGCLERFEQSVEKRDFAMFGRWYSEVSPVLRHDRENLFFSTAGLQRGKSLWLSRESNRLLELMRS